MTTVADRIAEIKARAVARGHTPSARPAAPILRDLVSPLKQQPHVSALDRAINRKPPLAFTRHNARAKELRADRDYLGSNNAESRARRLAEVECRVVAWLVSKALGPDWSFESNHEFHVHSIIHKPSGATLKMRIGWQELGRYRISPDQVYRRDELPETITVSASRPAASIAADIKRRIIDAGLIAQHELCKSGSSTRRNTEIERRRQCLAIAQAYGGTLRHERHWSSSSYPEGQAVWLGQRDDEGHAETSITTKVGYSGQKIEIITSNVELAVKVAQLVRSYYHR